MQNQNQNQLTVSPWVDIIQLYRERAPRAPTVLDYSPGTGLWAVQNCFPLSGKCTNTPGKDLVRIFSIH